MASTRKDRVTHITATVCAAMLLAWGCAPTVTTFRVDTVDKGAKGPYLLYLYSGGQGGWTRAALLKTLDAAVEIVPYAPEIVESMGTFSEAMTFMKEGKGYREIVTRGVTYKGSQIGYLLTYAVYSYQKEPIEVNLYERGGRIHFAVREIIPSD